MTIVYYLAAALLVALDQVTKFLTRTYLAGQGTVTVIPGVVGLAYVENTGMAFSAFSGYTAVLAVLSFVVSLLLIVAIKKRWLPHPFCGGLLCGHRHHCPGRLPDLLLQGGQVL